MKYVFNPFSNQFDVVIDNALFRRHTLEAGDNLTIEEDEQKLVLDTFFINGTGSLTVNGSGELCVIGA